MTNETRSEPAVDRRFLLRGGAVLAGAAGATVIGAALAPSAQAADGEAVLLGKDHQATSTTTVTIDSVDDAALSLVNAKGPSLQLNSVGLEYVGDLDVGEIANTDLGPDIGVDYGDGATTDFLATGNDLDGLPTPVAIPPQRLLDTRKAGGRGRIVRASSSTAITAEGKLRGGQWIDVAIETAESDDFALSAVFVNAAVIGPAKNGWLIVYPPSDTRPGTSTINFRAGVSLANAAFVGVGIYDGDYVVRIWTSETTHLLFDLSGAVAGAPAQVAVNKVGQRRAQRQAKQIARIKKSLTRS